MALAVSGRYQILWKMIRSASAAGVAAMLVAGSALQSAPDPPRILGVCAAVKSNGAQLIMLRGLGRVGEGGFGLFDHTCPLVADTEQPVVAIVLLKLPEDSLRARELMLTTALHQLVVEGRISCIERFQLEANRISGNGFGNYGRIACKLEVTRLLEVERWW